MKGETSATPDRRTRFRERVQALVETRTQTLALYSALAGARPFHEDEQTQDVLRDFCQALIDYTASAHFQLYRYIAENRERRQRVRDVADRVYGRIAETTDQILDFNDRYDVAGLDGRVDQLTNDLSSLGEILADRIQLEDEVIQAIDGGRC